MKTVYWSPWYPNNNFNSLHLLYDEPQPLLTSIKSNQNKNNDGDNWFQCHAFLNSAKNTFVLTFPMDITFGLHESLGVMVLPESNLETIKYVAHKQPSIEGAFTFSILNNWIFWSEESLDMTTAPSFLHPSTFNGFYVPGRFNINSWFRPAEAAFQLNKNVNEVEIRKGKPFAYVKFETNQPVILKRFYLNEDLIALSQACINYKRHTKTKGLNSLYNKFKSNGLDKIITRTVKLNVME